MDVEAEITAIKIRITKLEAEMLDVRSDVTKIKENTDIIVDAVVATKPWVKRFKKYGPHILTFIAGAGFLNQHWFNALSQLFGMQQ